MSPSSIFLCSLFLSITSNACVSHASLLETKEDQNKWSISPLIISLVWSWYSQWMASKGCAFDHSLSHPSHFWRSFLERLSIFSPFNCFPCDSSSLLLKETVKNKIRISIVKTMITIAPHRTQMLLWNIFHMKVIIIPVIQNSSVKKTS